MGDNRDNSMDSRFYGFVDREQIVGEAKRFMMFFDLNNWLKPRLSCFGQSLRQASNKRSRPGGALLSDKTRDFLRD